ncbi:Bug family tripartite tricarboxylate transporter substrate binding protein [Tardiphaga sp.]|jgi:tripartite-type tricarboxylate transporter receptor subunit TctC|uniref:Bug family tripartite tricarboxylate transporter substrate binding protein n=1 Tax=Tardiphaga sp. TaxID=1926292 RepID=UPI0037D9C9A1
MKYIGALSALLLACSASAAIAQQPYPNKPVRVIVPYAPGGSSSIFTRAVTDKLAERLGQSFVIDNRGGAGGNIGVDVIAKAPPDGYTIGLGVIATQAINPHIYPRMPYNPLTDFEPIAYLAGTPNVMAVNPTTVKAKTVAEFIVEAKASKRQFAMASSGVGTSIHLAGEMFKLATGAPMTHVPYRGSAQAITDLVAGQVDIDFDNFPSCIEQVKAGNLRALAVTSATRAPQLPDVPTLQESGLAGFDVTGWFALFAPKGTPRDIVMKLNTEINQILQTKEVQDQFAVFGGDIRLMTPEQLGAFVKTEHEKWGRVVKEAGVKIE